MKSLLQKKYSDILQQPINQIYKDLKTVARDVFADDERIVFIDDVVDCPQKTHMVNYIDQILEHLDIDKFFIQIVDFSKRPIDDPTNFDIPDTVCVTPWVGLEIDVDGSLHSCCLWERSIKDAYIQTTKFVDYFKQPAQQQIKTKLLQGEKPTECSKCWVVESAGGTSKRLTDNYVFREHRFDIDYNNTASSCIVNLDIKLGNKCNLACRICNPICSSTWSQFKDAVSVEFNWVENESSTFWQDIISVSKDVKYITFAGGEPLLDKTHRKLLQYFIDNDLAKQVSLHYNTNGTVYADFLFEYWDQFKTVELSFSIDNVGKQFEYERFGIPWLQVSSNLKKYADNTTYTLNFYSTMNALSLSNSYETFCYAKQLGIDTTFSLLESPKELSITSLPNRVKSYITDKLLKVDDDLFKDKIKSFISIMHSQTGEYNLVEYLQEQDALRGQEFKEYYPEIFRLFDQETS